ncbi:PREDICTED: beta-glucosidase 18-like [Nelumbo nucifera]|uniref:Beta-glucosidase 18-like n=1 Tax=Nelumbo nucifera TaxID=4432 RepID=A0A1U7ZBU0_NELNU|nr:PREDICTED: beta-glucosidase 18-like [Nelumbo nucifera]
MRHHLGARLPKFSVEESKTLNGSIDFIGINHYSSLYAKDCINSPCPTGESHAFLGFVYTTGFRDGVAIGEPTPMPRFFIVPDGLEKMVEYIKTRYNNKPIFVTENGLAQSDQPAGKREDLLNDNKRIEFFKGYLASLARAIRNGADVRGYFVWSLMDNFEWTRGFSMRFGLYYVDYQTLERTPKLSAKWYRDFLTPNATDEYDDMLVKRSSNNLKDSQLERC